MAKAIPTDIHPDRFEIPTALETKNSRHFSCPEETGLYPSYFMSGPNREKGDVWVFPGQIPGKKIRLCLLDPVRGPGGWRWAD